MTGRSLLVAIAVTGGQLALGSTGTTASTAGQEVTVVQVDLVDPSRATPAVPGVPASSSRTLETTVYLPAAVDPAPLIVLAHGAGGAPEKFTQLATYWADQGYVVAMPRFPLTNDRVPQPVLGDFPEQGRDVRFVIDELLDRSAGVDDPLAGRIDPERLGLFGLSLGSLTVWSETFGDVPDARVDAVVQSDGVTLVAEERIGSIDIPVLIAHSDVDPIFPYLDVVARYDGLVGPKFLLTLHGAGHATVGENIEAAADTAYREATTAFWDRTLGGVADAPFPLAVAGVTSFVDGPRPAVWSIPATR